MKFFLWTVLGAVVMLASCAPQAESRLELAPKADSEQQAAPLTGEQTVWILVDGMTKVQGIT
jgi:uncharacterized lipoprotein YajG